MIYLDNSATTFPKPPEVIRAVRSAVTQYGFNPGRGGYQHSLATAQKVYEARELIADFFHSPSIETVIFTPGCTQSLNMVIKGVLRRGDHVVISSFEHNAVLRPLTQLREKGWITYDIAEVVIGDDDATINHFREKLNEKTKMIICTHASNVFGFRLPTERICALAHSYQILFCLDAAQSAGIFPINMKEDGYDFVCCAGHKYLYGPMGIGLLLLGKNNAVEPLIAGGTGSLSSESVMPDFYPDHLEAGTQNISGILGLRAGVAFVQKRGIDAIYGKETRLLERLHRSLRRSARLHLFSRTPSESSDAPVSAFTVKGLDSETVAKTLSQSADIAVRGGLHCAPLAHRSMGTLDRGIVRISPSIFTTEHDMNLVADSLRKFM